MNQNKKIEGEDLPQLAAQLIKCIMESVPINCGLILVAFNTSGSELHMGIGANCEPDLAKRVLSAVGKSETLAEGLVGGFKT